MSEIMRLLRYIFTVVIMMTIQASALDWTQRILDLKGQPIPDCPIDPETKVAKKCSDVITLGPLIAFQLENQDARNLSATQKQTADSIARKIMDTPSFTPTPDELVVIIDAAGKINNVLLSAASLKMLGAAVK
jgi:hypothetical protein